MSPGNDLTPDEQEFELALKSLAPLPARVDPGAAAAEAGRRRARRRRRWQAAAAVVTIVLLGAWQAIGPQSSRQEVVRRTNHDENVEHVTAFEPPTLLDYRWTLMKSPSELDALLDRQARLLTGVNNDRFGSLGAPVLWNANIHASLGEL